MGAYTWLSDSEFIFFKQVTDKDIQEALDEVRLHMPEWYVSERFEQKKRWFRKPVTTVHYTVYQQVKEGYSEVRVQLSAQTKATVLNLLYGLYMGYHCGIKIKES